MHAPSAGQAGVPVEFHALAASADAPVLGYRWEFGDVVSADGANVSHAYTQPGQYTVKVASTGLNGRMTQNTLGISVTGMVPTVYNPAEKERYSKAK